MFLRRLGIKKFIFAALMIPSLILLSCKDPYSSFTENNFNGNNSPAGRSLDEYSVTVYLDGQPPAVSSRAMTKDLAVLGHDFFEIAFFHPDTNTIARAAWEKGHPANIIGVYRTESGINYGYVDPGALAASQGAAILFVGKRSDKTLLGVGKLINVDDGNGNKGNTLITDKSVSVTFSVAAFNAGANLDKTVSSFWTATASASPGNPSNAAIPDNTEVSNAMIGSEFFPLYRLPQNVGDIRAQYRFAVSGPDNFDDFYKAGILLANAGGSLKLNESNNYHLTPRYLLSDGQYEEPSVLYWQHDNNTVLTMMNNTSYSPPPVNFQNPVEFRFNTNGTADGSIFAFAFEIPVYPLSNYDNRGQGNFWYIRPGYDSYIYDLDSGRGGTGGALLIGTGNVEQSFTYHLYIGGNYKIQYNAEQNDYLFDLTGMQIYLRIGDIPVKHIPLTDPDLKFYLGGEGGTLVSNMQDIQTILTNNPGYIKTSGMVNVRVEYRDGSLAISDPPYVGGFGIYIYNPSDTSRPNLGNVPQLNRIAISSQGDLDGLETMMARNDIAGTFIIVFYHSFNFSRIMTVNLTNSLIILIAARPNITIGRSVPAGAFRTWGANSNDFFVGMWPFNETLYIGGQPVISHPFTLNAAGEYTTTAAIYTGSPFFNFASNQGEIFFGTGMTILNDDYLK